MQLHDILSRNRRHFSSQAQCNRNSFNSQNPAFLHNHGSSPRERDDKERGALVVVRKPIFVLVRHSLRGANSFFALGIKLYEWTRTFFFFSLFRFTKLTNVPAETSSNQRQSNSIKTRNKTQCPFSASPSTARPLVSPSAPAACSRRSACGGACRPSSTPRSRSLLV